MKNRLQFNRMPKLYASREEATAALELHYKDSSFIPLIGEPLVVRYYDENGDKQAILAIGKATGKTADDKFNREYHIIDTAEINENVAGASFSAGTALDLASAATQSVNNYFVILRNMIEAEGIDLDDGSYFDDDDPTKDPSTCGKYKPLENSNYLDDAKNLREADKLLDEAIGGVSDDLDELSAATVAIDAKVGNLSDKVDDLKIVKITNDLPANAREIYELHDADDRRKGEKITIYKDSSLIRAYLGHADDYLADPRSSDVTEGTGDAALCFIYQDYEGLYTLIPINVETFLEENEFGEGLVVNNHVVSVNSAITGEMDRAIAAEKYLSGITNNIIQAAGLTVPGEEGKYPGHSGVTCYYISAATSLDNADVILDNAIHALSGVVADIGGGEELEELSAVTAEFSATTNYKFGELSGVVIDNEEVTAAALNDLNRRVGTIETHMTGEYIPITGYILASGTTEEELILDEDDTVNEAFSKLQKQILDNEEAVAAGLNDLNRRVIENTEAISKNTGVKTLSGAVMSFSAATDNKFNIQNTNIKNLSGSVVNNRTDINILSGLIGTVSAKTSGVLTIELNGEEQGKYSPSADTVVSLTAITEVTGADVLLTGYELATGTTEEELAIVASDNVNEAFGKIQKQMYDNEAVVAGALNDLDERIHDIEGGGGTDNFFDGAEYDSNTKRINFKHGNEIKSYIDATDFIKDGMVDSVSTGTPTEGSHAGVECLIITFNTDAQQAGKETIEIPLSDIFDASLLDDLSGSVVNNFNNINTLSADTIENELVIAAALNDLNDRIIDLSGVTGDMYNDLRTRIDNIPGGGDSDLSNYYTKQEVDAISGSIVTNLKALSSATVNMSGAVVNNKTELAKAITAITLNNTTKTGTNGGVDLGVVLTAETPITLVTAGTGSAVVGLGINDHEITVTKGDVPGGGGISGVKMNGNVVSNVDNYADLGTVLTSFTETQLSKGTATGNGNVVTDLNVNDHVITLVKSFSAAPADQFVTLSGAAHNKITALSAATTGINSTLNTHIENDDIHVTAAEKNIWNNKQNAITNLQTIIDNASSGAIAYNDVRALSSATLALSAITLTGVTTNGDGNAVVGLSVNGHNVVAEMGTIGGGGTAGIAGIKMNGSNVPADANGIVDLGNIASSADTHNTIHQLSAATTAHTANTTMHVTANEKSTWNGKQDAISDLQTIRNNASSGAIAYNDVRALSAATTAHTANTTMHVTAAEKNTWNGKQDAISDLKTIRDNAASGAIAYNDVRALSSATINLSGATTAINSTLTTVSGAAHNKITALSGGTIQLSADTKGTFDKVFGDIDDIVGDLDNLSAVTITAITVNGDSTKYTGDTNHVANIVVSTGPGNGITGVTMNGANRTVTNNVVDLGTVVTAQTELTTATTGTGNVVGSIDVQNHKITSTLFSAASADQIAKLSAATVSLENASGGITGVTMNGASRAVTNRVVNLGTVVCGITMNNSPVTVTNGVANLGTIVTAQTELTTATTGTGNVMTDITVSNHRITKNLGMTVASSADTHNAITAVSQNVQNNYYNTANTYNKTQVDGMVKKEFQTKTSVTNLALDKFLTIVTLSSNANLTIASNASWSDKIAVDEVFEAHVIIHNSNTSQDGGIIVTVANDNRLKITGDAEILIDPNGYGEVNALITRTSSGYDIYIITS